MLCVDTSTTLSSPSRDFILNPKEELQITTKIHGQTYPIEYVVISNFLCTQSRIFIDLEGCG